MEHRETEEMHEAVDQMLRSALIAVGSVQQRLARRQQVAADQARMVAAASRAETAAYTTAQDTMLRQSLRKATDPMWFDTSTPAERVATRDMADRYSEVSPYAKTVLDRIDTEASRRGEQLTATEAERPGTRDAEQNTGDTTTPSAAETNLDKPDLVKTDVRSDGVSGEGTSRRPVAVDTTATEQEVADRLSASRSFPRPPWARAGRGSAMKLRPGSPTTMPRSRDQGMSR